MSITVPPSSLPGAARFSIRFGGAGVSVSEEQSWNVKNSKAVGSVWEFDEIVGQTSLGAVFVFKGQGVVCNGGEMSGVLGFDVSAVVDGVSVSFS
jgi:hypothetical protein